jgi:signal transduction histidine kinase
MPAADGHSFHALFAIQDVTDLTDRIREYQRMRDQALAEARERRRAEEALQHRNRELDLLNRAGQALTSTLNLDEVLDHVLEEVRRLLGVVASSIWLLDRETGDLVCQQASGLRSEIVRGWRLAPGEGFVGWAAQTGQSLLVSDVSADDRHFDRIDQQTGLMLRSILSVPLQVKEDVIGVLQVMDSMPGRFNEADLELLTPLAASAAIAVDNAALVETLRQRTVELEARNEELDAFAHTAAHDLKGPLGYMVGFAQILSQDYSKFSEEELRRYLELIARSGRKMSNIIDEMLLLASTHKLEDVQMRPLDMAFIVENALQRLSYLAEENQAEIIRPDRWPTALGYAPWIEEVWVNYLSNAIKYGGQPPRIELGASLLTEDGTGDMVRFWVRDNGAGLTPEEQGRLFKPFTRLDQVRTKGHGLGLSIVQRIVEKLGGRVGIESDVGQGSTFSFTLASTSSPEKENV